jgi:hypothetical protein
MERREALKRLAMLSGGALSLSTVSAILRGCTPEGGPAGFQTLTNRQNELVTTLSDLIIPETETPGARAAGVNRFIDKMLTDWNTTEENEHFLKGLRHVDEVSDTLYQQEFLNLSRQQQAAVLRELAKEAEQQQASGENNLKPFFSQMKEYTVVGYYTSEIGASQELKLNQVPGYLDACVPYEEVGRAWSLPK